MDVSSGGAGSIEGSEVEKKEGSFVSGVSLASLRSLVLVRVFEKEKGLGWPGAKVNAENPFGNDAKWTSTAAKGGQRRERTAGGGEVPRV